jgi:hypothetical protein
VALALSAISIFAESIAFLAIVSFNYILPSSVSCILAMMPGKASFNS